MVEQAEKISFTIDKSQGGQRLDIFLAQIEAALSRSQVKYAIKEGDVLVNDKAPKVSQHLKEGDVIILIKRPPMEAKAVPQEMPLDIVYEDDAVIIINKPAGMVVHPAPGNPEKTLVNALLYHCHDLSGIGGVLRPGIVHRLDKDTSGLIVAAKSDEAHRSLSAQFEKHDVHKKYLALVWGDVKGSHGEIMEPVGRHPVNRKKMSTKSKHGRGALTLWKVRERYGVVTLLDLELKTGRTHQIRVHLSSRGYPVVGDSVYGNTSRIKAIADLALKSKLKAFNRQALHATQLSFIHPQKGERMVFTSDMPQDMIDLCAQLRLSIKQVDSKSNM
ncbi:MAG: RluA family pseudouridine synthase [Syntrophaceae bacterium]|nr:RluA family pseudouridine synthase [Syntrophaceae bacterium]